MFTYNFGISIGEVSDVDDDTSISCHWVVAESLAHWVVFGSLILSKRHAPKTWSCFSPRSVLVLNSSHTSKFFRQTLLFSLSFMVGDETYHIIFIWLQKLLLILIIILGWLNMLTKRHVRGPIRKRSTFGRMVRLFNQRGFVWRNPWLGSLARLRCVAMNKRLTERGQDPMHMTSVRAKSSRWRR